MRVGGVTSLAAAALAAVALCAASVAHAQDGRWLRAESTNFIVHSELGERQTRQSLETLERFDAWLRFLLGARAPPSENKLEVYVFRSSLEEVWPDVSSGVRGFYTPGAEMTAAFTINTDGGVGLGSQEVLFHEYAHHFMLRYFAGAYPKWFVEGFAEFVMTTEFRENAAWVGGSNANRRSTLENDAWVPMNRMLTGDAEGRDIYRFYAQSWLMANYVLLNAERKAGFARYLTAFRSGADAVTAFEPAFGVTQQQFQNELRRHLNVGLARREIPFPPAESVPISIARLPDAADDLLPLLLRLRRFSLRDQRADTADERNKLIADALAAADRHPDDILSKRVRAMALMARGDYAQARAAIEPLLSANADNVELQYLMGRSYLAEAEAGAEDTRVATATQGRRYFARVFRLNPRHAPTLYAYARTFPQPLDEATMDVLLEARRLSPHATEISLYTASALMRLQRGPEAVPILEAVAYAPHNRSASRRALQLLEAAKRNEPPPPPAPEPAEEDD